MKSSKEVTRRDLFDIIEKKVVANCDAKRSVSEAMDRMLELHDELSKYDVHQNPCLVYCLAYQDGVIHAFERFFQMYPTGDYNHRCYMSQIRVTDWTGKVIHKKKRGFSTKKEALQWERDFIRQSTGSIGMTFQDFIQIYLRDMEQRLKPSTMSNKRWQINLKITPYFSKMPLQDIKATDVRNWQNTLTSYRDENGNYNPKRRFFCTI